MRIPKVALLLGVVVLALVVYNGVLTIPVAKARKGESGITMVAYRRWLVDPTTAVIDVHVDPDKSMADMDRNLFSAAEALKWRHFTNVELAYHGRGRFLLDGDKFQEIGEQWQNQSIMYLISAVPQAARHMDGAPAFGTWEGGVLGVMTKEIQDHNQLHWSWYLANMAGADPESKIPDQDASTDL